MIHTFKCPPPSSSSLRRTSAAAARIESRLHQALLKEQFELLFQPQVSLKADALIGVEALIRWRGDDGELISPLDFIPLAEETGMIVAIGNWVLEAACNVTKQGYDQGLSIIMSVNLSPRQLRHPKIHHDRRHYHPYRRRAGVAQA